MSQRIVHIHVTAGDRLLEDKKNVIAMPDVKQVATGDVRAGKNTNTDSGDPKREDVAAYLVEMIESLQVLSHQHGLKSLSYMLDIARTEAENAQSRPAAPSQAATVDYEKSIDSD